jgi:hypothetical protein
MGDHEGNSAIGLTRLALAGALVALASALPQPSSAAGFAASAGLHENDAGLIPILHGHSARGMSFYCYPRNYWWFYRPYTTAAEGYARCMPYFHYPPESLRGRRGPVGVK